MAHSFLKDPGSKVGVLLGNLYFRGASRGYWNSELGTEKLKQLPRGGNIEPFPGVPGSQSRRACCEQPGLQTLPKASWLLRLLRFHRPLGWGALSSPHLPQGSPAAGLCPSSSTAAGLVSKPAGPLLSGAVVVAPFAPRLLGASPCQMFLGSPAAAE